VSKRAKKLGLKEEEIKLKPVIAFDCGTLLVFAILLLLLLMTYIGILFFHFCFSE
jgi:hypothetical protein